MHEAQYDDVQYRYKTFFFDLFVYCSQVLIFLTVMFQVLGDNNTRTRVQPTILSHSNSSIVGVKLVKYFIYRVYIYFLKMEGPFYRRITLKRFPSLLCHTII